MISSTKLGTSRRSAAALMIGVMIFGTVFLTFSSLNILPVRGDSTINVNRQDTFEGDTFNTTGTLTYNSTFVTGGSLTVKATAGSTTITVTYTIKAQRAGHNAVRFVLYSHETDSASLELAAYLYVDVSTGTVTSYFAARNDDFNQNGIIDINDYSFMSAHYGYCSGQSEYAPATDLNASGCTDINDYSVVQVTYGFPAYR